MKGTCAYCGTDFERKVMPKGNVYCKRECLDKNRTLSFSDSDKKVRATFNAYKIKCFHREIPFELTIDDFAALQNKECYYCGSKDNVTGYDRGVPSLGYVYGNVLPSCGVCNSMKLTTSKVGFINQCIKIAKHHEKL